MSATEFSPAALPSAPQPYTETGRTVRLGGFAGLALLGAFGFWAAVTPIAGAVIAAGQTVVHGKPKLLQSLDGGIVSEISVAAGDRVEAGQLLLRLDPTLIETNLEIARAQLSEALSRRARLEAEQLGAAAPDFVYPPLPFATPDLSRQEIGQQQIFQARAELMRGREARLDERRSEIDNQRAGLKGQIAAKRDQLALIDEDLGTVSRLRKEGLARDSQRLDLARARAEVLGQIAQLEAAEAQLANGLRDAEIQLLQEQREFKEGVVIDLREATAQIDQLLPQILTLETQLSRVEIRAPVAGIVHELVATTVGGVVAPGEVMMQVVPLDNGLDFTLKLDPRQVDQVHPGQAAQVVLAALDPQATPKLAGIVATISPDSVADPHTGARYYEVELTVPPEELARLDAGVDLLPGMPIEAFLETGDRTVLRYILKPITSQIARAFREE